jgi:serine/threonine protein kinase
MGLGAFGMVFIFTAHSRHYRCSESRFFECSVTRTTSRSIGRHIDKLYRVKVKEGTRKENNSVARYHVYKRLNMMLRSFDVFAQLNVYYFVQSFADGGDLLQALKTRGVGYPEDDVRDFEKMLLDAIIAILEKRIDHRDLKPQNILLTNAASHNSENKCDFGFARHVPPTETTTTDTPVHVNAIGSSFLGRRGGARVDDHMLWHERNYGPRNVSKRTFVWHVCGQCGQRVASCT